MSIYSKKSFYIGRAPYPDGIYNGGESLSVVIGENKYRVSRIGNKLWLAENFKETTTNSKSISGHTEFGLYYPAGDRSEVSSILQDGWRIPYETDFNILGKNFDSLRAHELQSKEYPAVWPDANNKSGFTSDPSRDYTATVFDRAIYWSSEQGLAFILKQDAISTYNFGTSGTEKFPVRLCKDVGSIHDMTLRFKFSNSSYNPVSAGVGSAGTWTKRNDFAENVWDWTNHSKSWFKCFNESFMDNSNIVEVIDAGDTSAVTNTQQLFRNCSSLKSVCLFDTSNVTDMGMMFTRCSSLERIPLLNTSRNTTVNYMFLYCYKVSGGALALYQQMASQSPLPENRGNCFTDCGRDTPTGAAELAQIPSSWGGTGA